VRRLAAVLVLAAVLLPACSAERERPEGIVERWLVALNQGSAGRPQAYASDELSQEVLPRWEDLDPGELDVIEVGRARVDANDLGADVPFRVERLDGTTLERVARIERLDGAPDWRVERLLPPDPALLLPSEGGPAIGVAEPAWWVGAVAVALGFVLVSAGLMALVRRRTTRPA